MKLNNWIITRITVSLFALISTVLNILYFSNIISEDWTRVGFTLALLANVYLVIYEQKNREHAQAIDKTRRAIDLVMIFASLAWVVTYVMTIFR